MRILIGHNSYKNPGGEDSVVRTENQLLKDFGEETYLYERSNKEFDSYSLPNKLKYFRDLDYLPQTYREIRSCIKEFKPDVAHFHNIFYAISPAAYAACKDEGVPVIQSQHNFRLLCLNGLLFRNGKVCEDCMTQSIWQGVLHGCFQDSRLLSARTAVLLNNHRKKHTWQNNVDMFITASHFGKTKLIEAGIVQEKITVKPNFVYPDNEMQKTKKDCALYVGRLSQEKGVDALLKAWRLVKNLPLKIVGDGPLLEPLRRYAKEHDLSNVEFCGYIDQKLYETYMQKAKFLIVPSKCYENFPRIVAEAFSYGIPVIASHLGSLGEIIEDKKNGLLFDPNDLSDLVDKITWMISNDAASEKMSDAMYRIYKEKYCAAKNYERMMNIYKKVCGKEGSPEREIVYG